MAKRDGMAKRDDEQHPCVKEVSKAVAQVISIMKPGKYSSLPKSYRPISFLCHTYKLSGKKSRWRNQKNGLPQGSVISSVLFNVYTNDQPVHNETRSFIYADDLCIATQRSTFDYTETILTEALNNLGDYYERNHSRANHDRTQTCAFYLKNREASRKLNITWYNKHLEQIPNPVYLGVTLDRTLGYKEHIYKLKCKTSARNNIRRKLSNTKWAAKPPTIKTTALALCYFTAEYACPVWERSKHVSKLDPALNEACRSITGCLRLTSVENVYLLAGIAPPGVRRATTCRQERKKQIEDLRHSLYSHEPVNKRQKSRNSFVHFVTPLDTNPPAERLRA